MNKDTFRAGKGQKKLYLKQKGYDKSNIDK